MDEAKRIVVTGVGMMTSIGCDRSSFWRALVDGKSGIDRIRAFDPDGHLSQIASELHRFDPAEYMSHAHVRKMARVSHLAAAAAVAAVKDAELDLDKEDRCRVGCVIGSAAGDYSHIESQLNRFRDRGPGSVNPQSIPRIIPNMPACNAAIVLGLHGPNLGVATACATGATSIGMAFSILREGRADIILAGGAESTITPLVVDAYGCMRVLSRRNGQPTAASRPFDRDRDGFVIGEGAGVLVLESLEHARRRGAEPLAELRGFGMSSDAFNNALPDPSAKWASCAMKDALRDARLDPQDIGYINAHGTSTPVNDRIESNAIRKVFGDRRVPVSSNKSMLGHTLGAAGAIEAAATVLSIHHGILPPTINHETPDPDCDLDVIPNEAREIKVRAAMSNSFGFGGQNGALVFAEV